MSSPTNRNAKQLSKTTKLSGHLQNRNHVEKSHSPGKEKGGIYTQIKGKLKPPDRFFDVAHHNSLPGNTEKSFIQISSSIVSKEAPNQKQIDSGIYSYGCAESMQSETSGISCTVKSTRQENQYSLESLKEDTAKTPSKGKEETIGQLNCHILCETKNVEGNNCEVKTTEEMYETCKSLPLNASSNPSNDKKKERRKMAKKRAKDEKRKQRELEYKKNLHYPKGQRIQIIDHNTFHKILNEDGSLHNENKRSVLISEEFPSLNVIKRNNRFPVVPCQNSSVQSNTEKLRVYDKATNNTGQSIKISETNSVVNGEMVEKFCVPSKLGTEVSFKKRGKLPKKRDPIQIDILQCIKMVKSKDAVVETKKKLNGLDRRNDISLISGNELDSSNPQRSRGKKREKPKKKRPTRLKLVILQERELTNQLNKLDESNLPQGEQVPFDIETSTDLLTVGGLKLDQVEPVINVSNNEVVETVPASRILLASGGIKLEQVEPVSNVTDSEVIETVPGSMNLLTAGGIKLEQVEPLSNVSDNKVFETGPGSMNVITVEGMKLEKVEPIINVSDNEVVENVPGEEETSKKGIYECEVPSSNSSTALAVTNQFLNGDDDSQTDLLSSQLITSNQPYTNVRESVTDFVPSLLSSASEIVKKEKKEFTRSVKESHGSVHFKEDQHLVSTAVAYIKPMNISSEAVKDEILHNSQTENCFVSLDAVSVTDPDKCNTLHQTDCIKSLKREVSDAASDHKNTTQETEIHDNKFKPYCDHFVTPEINSLVTNLLQDIVKFHDRQFERDPVKANARRRHVAGLREVLKYLNLKRLKLIIIAPDMELIQGKGGICDIVEQLKEGARNQEIPYVFALRKRIIGKLTFKKVPVSCIGIINYSGTEKNYHSLVAALQVARAQYQEALTNLSSKDTSSEEVDVNKQVIQVALSRLKENNSTCCTEHNVLCSEMGQKQEE